MGFGARGSSGAGSGPTLGVLADQHVTLSRLAVPGWEVVSSFYLEEALISAVGFEAIMLVSQVALAMSARLYDIVAGAAVAGSTLGATSSITDDRKLSVDISAAMPAGQIYQVQIACVGGELGSDFGILRAAKLIEL